MKRGIKRTLAIVLGLVLSLGLVANIDFTSKAASDKTTVPFLTSEFIMNPESGNGGWSYVYFGKLGSTPFKYRILSKNTTEYTSNSNPTMLLDADSLVSTMQFGNAGTKWANSNVRAYLNDDFINNSFSDSEKNAIAESNKDSYTSGAINCNDALESAKIFVLSQEEINNVSLGYKKHNDSSDIDANKIKKYNGSDKYWWTRSSENDSIIVAEPSGSVNSHNANDENCGVSPALNVSLSSIISFSAVDGEQGSRGASYKMTLKDSNMSLTPEKGTKKGNKISVPFTVTGGSPTQISYVITNGTWTEDAGWGSSEPTCVKYGKADATSLSSGVATFDLIPSYDPSKMNIYLFAETVNDGNVTDYASAPTKIAYEDAKEVQVKSGEGQTIAQGAPIIASFDKDYSFFEVGGKVYVDDVLLDSMYYTSRPGSTVIELLGKYTGMLDNGEHTLRVVFNDNTEGVVKFNVSNSAVNSTNTSTQATATSTPNTTTKVTAPKTSDNAPFAVIGLVIVPVSIGGAVAYRKHKKA